MSVALASSRGLAVTDRVTDAYMKVVCRDADGRAGFGARAATAVGAIDGAQVAADAARRVATREPALVEPGEIPVVLDHDAVGSLLDMLALVAFNGLAHAEGQGALAGKLGTRVAAPSISLSDAPRYPGTIPRAFDAEGVPKTPLPLIQDGIAHAVCHDTRSAAVAGGDARSTGHALAPGGSAWGAAPTNMVLRGGGAESVDELAATDRARHLRDAPVVPEPRPRAQRDGHRRHARGHVPDRGRQDHPPPARRALHRLRPDILARTEALTTDQRLVSEGEFYGERFAAGASCPRCARRGASAAAPDRQTCGAPATTPIARSASRCDADGSGTPGQQPA